MDRETKLIVEANRLWETEKDVTRDVSRAISRQQKHIPKELRAAIMEAGRAGFVHGYLLGKDN